MVFKMSSIGNKIRELRNGAQETQAAIKIKDKLTELRSKDVFISSCRWIWELIQNAKDCPNSSKKIDIEINFDTTAKKVVFKHNGKLFTTKNLVYLIEQVSTKERSRSSSSTGKFGTGFLTTNLLSPIVTISGLLYDEGDANISQFNVTLDRSGNSIDELKTSIKNSCEQLERDTKEISGQILENNMNTSFTYELDDRGVNATINGLDNFLITAPYVFAFVSELNKISINYNGNLSVYTRKREGNTQSSNMFVSRICKNDSEPINILAIKGDSVMLAVNVIQSNGENHIAHYDANLPKLFCDFPLLGTHDFPFPVVINSGSFDPNEPRNGLILNGDESTQNKEILEKACELFVELMNYFIHNNYKDIYNVVCLSSFKIKDWIDQQWYNEKIIDLLKIRISQLRMFNMTDGSRQSLCDERKSNNIFLSNDDDKEIRNGVWRLSSQLFPNKHVQYEDIDNWFNSLWDECRNYGILELISEVEKIGSIKNLKEKIPDAVEWLKQLYELINMYSKYKYNVINMSNRKIYPNQHGDFCLLNALNEDSGIDEEYKIAAETIGVDLKSELLDNNFRFENMKIMTFTDVVSKLIYMSQNNNSNLVRFYMNIISIQYVNDLKQIEFISLYNKLFSHAPISIKKVSNSNQQLLGNALIYICDKLCKCISGLNNLSNFSSSYGFKSVDASEIWLSDYIQFITSIDKADLLDKNNIIPNQNGSFKSKSMLYQEGDSIPEFMKDVCRIAGTDFREEMVSTKIETSKIIPRKKGYKEIADVITGYMREHMNNITVNPNEKEVFNETYRWLRERKDDSAIKQYFQELLNHLYWFYNDDEISESISKANDLDNVLSKFGISNIKQLEDMLIQSENTKSTTVSITEDLLCQYGISSQDELQCLIDSRILGEDFIHEVDSCVDKFQFAQKILQRAFDNIQKHLRSLSEYDLSTSTQVHKTVFTAKKDGREIYIIARPSDYNEVILYYDAEFEILDYTKDFELWVEDGKTNPQKLTFGRILRLTGVNRIPLRSIK